MKDNEIAKMVNELRKIAKEYHAHGLLREKIRLCVLSHIKSSEVKE